MNQSSTRIEADRISVSPKKKSPARIARDARRNAGHASVRIENTSRKRQAAWSESGQPFVTGRLTAELDGLYVDKRAVHIVEDLADRRAA